jgi:hypothetical protein
MATYLAAHPFPGKVVSIDLASSKLPPDIQRRFGATPQLLVVDRTGFVRRAWTGALFGDRQTEAEAYFGVRLPGVKMAGGIAAVTPAIAATR